MMTFNVNVDANNCQSTNRQSTTVMPSTVQVVGLSLLFILAYDIIYSQIQFSSSSSLDNNVESSSTFERDDDRFGDYEDIVYTCYMFWCHVVVAIPIVINSVVVPLYITWALLIIFLRIYNDNLSRRKEKEIELAEQTAATIKEQQQQRQQRDASASSDFASGITTSDIEPPLVDISGSYQLVKNENFEAFLATQGVPWALRGAANRARPKHIITQNGNSITIQIIGIIESTTTYIIGGPPNTSNVRGRIFEDSVTYLEDKSGIQTLKRAVHDHYTITVVRQLSSDKMKLTLTSTATFDEKYVEGPKDPIQAIQHFERIVE